MFIGHYAVGLASKKLAPRASLGWLVAAPILLDLVWPIFLLLGIERVTIVKGDTPFTPLRFDSYPWSHSLLTACLWGLVMAGLYFFLTRYRAGAIVIFIGVVSHWVLDAVAHRPDLPLWPFGGPKVGLSLWNSVFGTLAVEIVMFAVGLRIYVRNTRARDATGRRALLAFVVFLAFAYAGAAGGPPPPSVTVVAWMSLATWLMPVWAAWIDKHRVELTSASA